ncbi:MAG: hypothetical protein JSR32_11225 [Proteobacteria bacterium]|nr:hypothetical protein [Pseudomonadota bacterium]
MSGNYYTFEGAIKFLSSELTEEIHETKIADWAHEGSIRLCARIDMHLCKFSIVKEPMTPDEFNKIDFNFIKKPAKYDPQTCFKETLKCEDGYGFLGYIEIPQEKIRSSNETVQFSTIKIIEVKRPYHKNRNPLTIESGSWLAKAIFNVALDKWLPDNFTINPHDAFIPLQDLQDLIKERKNNGQSKSKQIANPDTNKKPTTQQETPPGKLPNTAIGKLAVKVAWELECKLDRRATADEVIKELQRLVSEEDILVEKITRGVRWVTTKLKEKDYDTATCGQTLDTWHKSRA